MSENDFILYIDGQPVQVSKEVYREFMRAEEKERYFMRRLKKGRFLVDSEQQTVTYIPSREASYEQLLEEDWDFPSPGETVDDTAVKAYLLEKLQEALHSLSDEEMALIQELFYLEKTEREAAALFQLSQNTIHYRKNRVLEKLKRFFEK